MANSNRNDTLAVVSQSGQSLSFYDLSSGARTGYLEDLIAEPHELCYEERTNLLYISHAYAHGWYAEHGEDCSTISVVDCGKREIIGNISTSPYAGPHGLAIDRNNNILFVSIEVGFDEGYGGIIGIDLENGKIVKAIGSGYKSHWFVMTPDGKKAYTCNKEAEYVSIIDLIDGKLLGRIEMPGGCEQPGISQDGKLAYFPTPAVPNGMKRAGQTGDFGISVIDTKSDVVIMSIPMELGALTVHTDANDRLIVGQYRFDLSSGSPRGLNGKLAIFASPDENFRTLASFDTGIAPLTIFSSLDGRKAFASAIFTGTVTVVDIDKMCVEKIIEVDTIKRADKKMHQGAHGLALVPYSVGTEA